MNFEYPLEERRRHLEFAGWVRERLTAAASELDSGPAELRQQTIRRSLGLLAARGYLGLCAPAAGGLLGSLPWIEHLAGACPSTCLAADVSAFLVGGLIRRYGSPEQKARFLDPILRGECLAACALDERGGYHPGDLASWAQETPHGWRLNGRKWPVFNMPGADLVLALAITDEKAGERGLSLFLVPTGTAGLLAGRPQETSGLRGLSRAEVTLRDCALPEGSLLGASGDGLAIVRDALADLHVRHAAIAIGISRRSLELALAHAREREVGGRPILKSQEVAFRLADMQTMIDASFQLAAYAAWLRDCNDREAPTIAATAKLFAAESAVRIAHLAQQVFGKEADLAGTEIERLSRDARSVELGFGATDELRAAIAEDVFRSCGKEERPTLVLKPDPLRRKAMRKRVAICAVAQTAYERNRWDERFQGMALEVLEPLLRQTRLDFSEDRGITHVVSVSDDIFDARTISDCAMTDVLGAHFRSEEKVAQDGAQAIYYACATILSGHADLVLVLGHSKESQASSRNMVTHMAFDPFYTRPVGLDFLAAAALQAQAYMARSNLTERQLARIVARARGWAAKNRLTASLPAVTEEDVMSSPLVADPIRELHIYPVSDGALGLILASEERAKDITDRPVWITGVGNSFDSFFLGDRDLARSFALEKAAERAYGRAGIGDPKGAFDLVELSDQYAYQQPLWAEGLGLCEAGAGPRWLDEGGPDRMNVNHSGGMLAGNPLILGGLVRVAEAALQLMGKAEERQVAGAKRALAHGVMGPAGQFHTVVILERD